MTPISQILLGAALGAAILAWPVAFVILAILAALNEVGILFTT